MFNMRRIYEIAMRLALHILLRRYVEKSFPSNCSHAGRKNWSVEQTTLRKSSEIYQMSFSCNVLTSPAAFIAGL